MRSILLFLMVLLIAAGSEQPASVEAGYRAYLQGEYDQALRHYEEALKQSHDPGRWACELGAIAAQAHRYAEASLWFSRAMEDATGVRRVQVAYGEGTALVHTAASQPKQRALVMLKQAISLLTMAEREWKSHSAEELSSLAVSLADIQHNRTMAETVLQQKQQEPDPPDSKEPETVSLTEMLKAAAEEGNGGSPKQASAASGNNTSENTQGTADSAPGRGSLPTLPDDAPTQPLQPAEAERWLELLRQRLRQPLYQTPSRPGSKDW